MGWGYCGVQTNGNRVPGGCPAVDVAVGLAADVAAAGIDVGLAVDMAEGLAVGCYSNYHGGL